MIPVIDIICVITAFVFVQFVCPILKSFFSLMGGRPGRKLFPSIQYICLGTKYSVSISGEYSLGYYSFLYVISEMQNDFFSHYMKLTPHIVDAKRGQRLKIMKALNKVAPFLTLKLPYNV